MNYRVILEPQPDGGYTVYVPSLPGCISEGDDQHEALNNIREAIALYRESLAERNVATPSLVGALREAPATLGSAWSVQLDTF